MEKIQNLISKTTSKFTEESSADDLLFAKEIKDGLTDLEADLIKLSEENAKLKEAVAKLVLDGGSATPPEDPSGGKTPRTLEEIVADTIKEGENK